MLKLKRWLENYDLSILYFKNTGAIEYITLQKNTANGGTSDQLYHITIGLNLWLYDITGSGS